MVGTPIGQSVRGLRKESVSVSGNRLCNLHSKGQGAREWEYREGQAQKVVDIVPGLL